MSYKSILVHVDSTLQATERIRIAARISAQQDAHLSGVATTGVAQMLFQNSALEFNDPNLGIYFDELRKRGRESLLPFDPLVRAAGVRSCSSQIVNDEAGSGFIAHARVSDLVVLGQMDPQAPSPAVSRDFPQYVLLNAGRPVLMAPYTGSFATLGERVLIAWDGGMEAARAVSGALPLLKRAKMVDVIVLNASTAFALYDTPAEPPGADLVEYLKRHGVTAEVSQQRTKTDIGNSLLTLAADVSADLLVMGGYGHSRFREMLLGGATRKVLEAMTVPVLMAH